jgi:hypothetical protein
MIEKTSKVNDRQDPYSISRTDQLLGDKPYKFLDEYKLTKLKELFGDV